jgi:glycyl-tRNA synthetase beta chain
MHANQDYCLRAGMLAKADLTTSMVGEFPELQGVMGCYYARNDHLPDDIAIAIREHYLPRFSGDELPQNAIGQALALADRLDTLLGAFGIHQIPTGDKDPYGLRRAAVGMIRILIEKNINLDLKDLLETAISNYTVKLENVETVPQVLSFIQERLRSFYQEQGVTADVFASVAALNIWNPVDVNERIKAVQAFKRLPEAETLSIANKRVSNILAKYVDAIDAKAIAPAYFENPAESELARQLEAKSSVVEALSQSGKYDAVLLQLADLRKPVDDFFDQVMVMTDDKPRRENRILLLSKLRALFLQVADIALLQ